MKINAKKWIIALAIFLVIAGVFIANAGKISFMGASMFESSRPGPAFSPRMPKLNANPSIVLPAPDLVVTISPDPRNGTPLIGGYIIRIENIGQLRAEKFKVHLLLDDPSYPEERYYDLNYHTFDYLDSRHEFTFSQWIGFRLNGIRAIVDRDNEVFENNERNNEDTLTSEG